MFGKSISLVSFLLLSSKVLAEIPAAFTRGFDPTTIELVATFDGPGEVKDGETLTADETSVVPKFALGDSSAISKSTTYIILMIDPDSPEKDDDTSKQVLHYMKTDFSVKEFTQLSSVATTPAMVYAGPSASVGTGPHRYIFLLYVQPDGFTNKLLPQDGSRDFNISAWRIENNLKPAVAGVHFVALPGGGAAPVVSSTTTDAATGVTTVLDTITVTPPCTTTEMWASTTPYNSVPVVGITTDTAVPPAAPTVSLIVSNPAASSVVASDVVPPAAAATHYVKVGGPGDLLLTYQPSWVDAAVGDVIKFDFLQRNHTVTQSTFDTPCVFNPAGVKSGFRANPDGVTGKEIFDYTVPDEKPKWFFCAQGTHCQAGMVFAVNPGTKFPEFVAKATGGAASTAPYPTTLVPTGTGGIATATGNVTAPGATGVPVFEGAASGGVTISWALAGVAGLLAFFL